MSIQYKLVRCNINGRDVEQMVDVRASLTDMLRNDFRLTSVKKGCEVGECGACNVLIDGECFNSCLYLAAWADGKSIRTLEGLMGVCVSVHSFAAVFAAAVYQYDEAGEQAHHIRHCSADRQDSIRSVV